jgi:YD repeat-containing protein
MKTSIMQYCNFIEFCVRTINDFDESTNVTEDSLQSARVTPLYDAAGNMTTAQKPDDPDTVYTLKYDAWGCSRSMKARRSR